MNPGENAGIPKIVAKMDFGPSKFTSPVYEPSPAEIDKALKYTIILMISHDHDYMQDRWC